MKVKVSKDSVCLRGNEDMILYNNSYTDQRILISKRLPLTTKMYKYKYV